MLGVPKLTPRYAPVLLALRPVRTLFSTLIKSVLFTYSHTISSGRLALDGVMVRLSKRLTVPPTFTSSVSGRLRAVAAINVRVRGVDGSPNVWSVPSTEIALERVYSVSLHLTTRVTFCVPSSGFTPIRRVNSEEAVVVPTVEIWAIPRHSSPMKAPRVVFSPTLIGFPSPSTSATYATAWFWYSAEVQFLAANIVAVEMTVIKKNDKSFFIFALFLELIFEIINCFMLFVKFSIIYATLYDLISASLSPKPLRYSWTKALSGFSNGITYPLRKRLFMPSGESVYTARRERNFPSRPAGLNVTSIFAVSPGSIRVRV